jgi:hypothetical protein
MHNKYFSSSEALRFGWDVMKRNFWFFVGVCIIAFLLSLTAQILQNVMENFPDLIPGFLIIPVIVIGVTVEVVVTIGLIKIALSFCDDRKPRLSTLFDASGYFFKYIGTALTFGLVVAGPILLAVLFFVLMSRIKASPFLVIPVFFAAGITAVVLSVRYSLCFYFVIDKGLGPINALKASSRTTMGAKWQLLVFEGLCGIVNLLGFICLGLGLFATFPTVLVALALVYRQLSQQTPSLADLCIDGPVGQPAGGIADGIAVVPPSPIESSRLPSLDVMLAAETDVEPPPRPLADVAASTSHSRGGKKPFIFVAIIAGAVVLIAVLSYMYLPVFKQAVAQPFQLRVTAILYSDDPSALIDGEIVKEGQTIKGATVVKIHRHEVELEKDGQTLICCPR